ncbi:hypothetical protein [Streptomyces sp. AcE210]|uniref:hypothetical protein n=1 Tax=Streptomyces sp. AcE210 TaxID=2292703 RepID=UPI000E30642B|nr:hypothetical protein [Streptomyces sp. AcE210]RFC73729.1 hypothetical protein DXZ75_44185 [Streptomyces sp. AcE210]
MTQQSGQGEDPHLPSVRQAHEGVVLPADGSEPLLPGTFGDQSHVAPSGGSPWGQPWGPESAQAASGGPMPTYEWGAPSASPALPGENAPHAAAPLPPAAPQQHYSAPLPPAGAPAAPLPTDTAPYGSAPLPPASASAATQYIAPTAPSDADATQYIAPVAPGALPPEVPADATQYLGRANAPGQMPPPQQQPYGSAPMPHAGTDSDATQYIAPVPSPPPSAPYGIRPGAPGDRQPPAEFDSLFRTEPEPDAPASTQQMPRFDPRAGGPAGPGGPGGPGRPGPAGQPQAPYEPTGRAATRKGQSRTGSKVPLIAAVGVGILVVGIGAGALISSGGEENKGDDAKPAAATGAPDSSSPTPADPAKAQAVALDKLLADSNNSRDTVIRAVADIGACKDLGKAASDLRGAATQRTGLVTRLAALEVDKLPDNAALTQALTKAWQASASADSHYAAWADQAAGKNGCKKGHAKPTPQRRAGDQASGTASAQKTQASKLWNSIATQWNLPQRKPFQL